MATITSVTFPPIPLATGDHFVDETGQRHPIAEVSLVISSPDGAEKVVRLDAQFGGWWVTDGR